MGVISSPIACYSALAWLYSDEWHVAMVISITTPGGVLTQRRFHLTWFGTIQERAYNPARRRAAS
jgi:hypothetical protein